MKASFDEQPPEKNVKLLSSLLQHREATVERVLDVAAALDNTDGNEIRRSLSREALANDRKLVSAWLMPRVTGSEWKSETSKKGKRRADAIGLPLGYRKALSRTANARTLEKALKDSHPQVIRIALSHPRISFQKVLSVAASPMTNPAVLAEVLRDRRWASHGRIRFSIVRHRNLHPDLATLYLPTLSSKMITEIERDPTCSLALRSLAIMLSPSRTIGLDSELEKSV